MVLDKKRPKPTNRADNVSLATKKNVVGATHLTTELSRLNREEAAELRMHNNARKKFIHKYDLDEDNQSEGSDHLSEAESPGGAARRNGESQYVKSLSVNMQDLHILLFTDGEIDIDKVLCLYLLTAHKTETLRLPPKTHRVGYKARLQSPLERLIERSKARDVRPKIFKTLPLFLLDVPVLPPKKEPRKDPRLANKVIVNTKILRIIQSVKTALEVCNIQLLRHFLYLAHDRSRIENTMMQPKMNAFYKSLYGQNILSSCESFQLETVSKKGSLSFRVDVEPLEELIRLIRSNVLLVPNSKSWKECTRSVQDAGADLTDHKSTPGPSSISFTSTYPESCLKGAEKGCCETSEGTSSKRVRIVDPPIELLPVTTGSMESQGDEVYFLDIEQHPDEEIDQRETMPKLQPKIMKNLQLGFSDMHLGDEEHVYSFDQNLPLEELAVLLDQKVKEEAYADYQNLIERMAASPSVSTTTTDDELELPKITGGYFNVKHTKCEACLKRWQEPLPTPKISKIKKFPMPQLEESSYYSSKSAQRISVLIDKKVRKLEQEEQKARLRTREEMMSHRQMQRLAKGTPGVDQTIEIIDLDEMDLAKIRQEIKEAETAKKLKKFYESIE